MLFRKLVLLSATAAIASAQDLDNSEIPSQCRAICASLVSTSQQCDNQTNDDAAELSCVCNSANARTLIPACDACVTQFGRDNDPDDVSDIRELLTRCNLSTTTFNSASASQLLASMSNAPSATSGAALTITTGTVAATSRPTTPSNSQNAASNANPISTGAAPAKTAAAGAAIGLGALGVAMGLL